jgi:hypothetical protein
MGRLASRLRAEALIARSLFFWRPMYLCYIDESGTPEIPGNTSHFILAGLSMPVWHWRGADREIRQILVRFGLENQELHTAWLLRSYLDQSKIANFETMDWVARRSAVQQLRTAELLRLQRLQQSKPYNQARKNYRHTEAYIHLTKSERISLVHEVADCVGGWGFSRLFAECIDKVHFDPVRSTRNVSEQGFEQVVSRFQRYLVNMEQIGGPRNYGLLIHDNNESVARKHTELMRHFHEQGTLWTAVDRIIDTPLFVDSRLTRMVQIADLCSVALRYFLENGETDLFDRIFARADRIHETVVGVRHFTARTCSCKICVGHRT